MSCEHVEKLDNNRFLVSIQDNKNDYPGQFIIGNLFYDKVQYYIRLRPTGLDTDRFFIKYRNGTFARQPIVRHTISATPQRIASYLDVPNTKKYTGHSLRRTSTTILSKSGANMQAIRQLGRWRSDIIVQGCIENSTHNRQMIFEGIIHAAAKTTPSTSRKVATPHEETESDGTIHGATTTNPSTSTTKEAESDHNRVDIK